MTLIITGIILYIVGGIITLRNISPSSFPTNDGVEEFICRLFAMAIWPILAIAMLSGMKL